MGNWLDSLKNGIKTLGSWVVEGATYDPEGTIGRYISGQEPISGESPTTVTIDDLNSKHEFANNNWALGYLPLVSTVGLSITPYLAPGTVGGNFLGNVAGGMAVGEGTNVASKALTGRTYGENIQDLLGYYGGEGLLGDLYRTGTEMANPFFYVSPQTFMQHSKAAIEALPQLFRYVPSNRLNAFWGPSIENFQRFDKAFLDGVVKNASAYDNAGKAGRKFLSAGDNETLMSAIRNNDYSNVTQLNQIQRKLAEEFYKMRRALITQGHRGKPTPEMRQKLMELDATASKDLARFNDPNFIVRPKRPRINEHNQQEPFYEPPEIQEKPKVVEQTQTLPTEVQNISPNPNLSIDDLIVKLEEQANPSELINKSIERSMVPEEGYNGVIDFANDFAQGKYYYGKFIPRNATDVVGKSSWKYADEFRAFKDQLAQSLGIDLSKLPESFSNYKDRYFFNNIRSKYYDTSTAGYRGSSKDARILVQNPTMDPIKMFNAGNSRAAHFRFKDLYSKEGTYLRKLFNDSKMHSTHLNRDGSISGKQRQFSDDNSTYSLGQEVQMQLYNYLRDQLGRPVTVDEYKTFIHGLSEDFYEKYFSKIHNNRYLIQGELGELPSKSLIEKWLKLYGTAGAVGAAASFKNNQRSDYKLGGTIKKRCKR